MIKLFFKIRLTLFVFCIAGTARAQLIDNSSTFRKIDRSSYFRFHYDNDYFTKTDEYYSQGITFEYVHPLIQRFPISKLLWKPFKTLPQYGVSFNVFGYTPTTILSDSILYGDRPFNASISLKTFLIQVDDVHQQQISSAFSIGVMGPAALGYDIQYNIHRWTKNPVPHGWQHQTKNDIIINYQLNYEKQLLSAGNNFLLNTTAEARLGTLDDKLSGGFNFIAGRFNKRYTTGDDKKRKVEYYFYGQGRANFIGYDASMQGGILNRKSPYVIAGSDVTRITFQADAGIILNFRKLYLSYTQSLLTKEFRTGKYHRWGGVSLGFAL
ncbi:MAG: lipid A deacylase LpxR family protein [Ferruginibacter sp.]